MTVGFALDYIEKRMLVTGHGENYVLKFRHFVLQPKEERKISAFNEYYLLIEESPHICVFSDFGLYDQDTDLTSELQYEHFGKIRIINKTDQVTKAKFIHAVPARNLMERVPIDTDSPSEPKMKLRLDMEDDEVMKLNLDT